MRFYLTVAAFVAYMTGSIWLFPLTLTKLSVDMGMPSLGFAVLMGYIFLGIIFFAFIASRANAVDEKAADVKWGR